MPAAAPASPDQPYVQIGAEDGLPTRVFISYRRADTGALAAHLHASLATRFGASKVFRDVVTMRPGQDYAKVIEKSIADATVVLVLIGKRWLSIKGKDGQPRLADPQDWVRLEIECALRQRIPVIPVVADDAVMPGAADLPQSIARLAALQKSDLQWQPGVSKLASRIGALELARRKRDDEERAALERLDLTVAGGRGVAARGSRSATASFNVVTRAMEISLERRGTAVRLSGEDLTGTIEKATKRKLDAGFLFRDLIRAIDFAGVKAQRSDARYVARSFPLKSLDEAVAHLRLKRPVLAGVMVFDNWFQEPASKTGFIDDLDPGSMRGSVVGAVVGFDPRKHHYKLLMPWPTWGASGHATLTEQAARRSLGSSTDLRSIEPVLMAP